MLLAAVKNGKVVVMLAFFSAGRPYCQYKKHTLMIKEP